MGINVAAGGAVGAVLGGRGARSSQNGGLGALRSARWRVREVVGRCWEGFGRSGERQGSSEGGFGSSWELISTLWGQLWVTLELIFEVLR